MKNSYENYWYLGTIMQYNARREALKVRTNSKWPPNMPSPFYVHILQHHTYVPYRVTNWEPSKHYLWLSVMQVRNEVNWNSESIFIEWEKIEDYLKKNFELDFLSFCYKFNVVSKQGEELGHVEGVIERPIQPLLIVQKGKEEYFVPVHKRFILEVNFALKTIIVQLPATDNSFPS